MSFPLEDALGLLGDVHTTENLHDEEGNKTF